MSNNPLQDVFDLFDKGKLKDQNEQQLWCLYSICVNCQVGDLFSRTKSERIAKAILSEILRLQNDRLVEQVGKLTQVADSQKLFAEQGVKQSENLSRQTDGLVSQIAALIIISSEQKNYAAKLERQTNKLIGLSWGLVIFSFVLLVVALIQTRIMFKQNSETHVPQIEAGQHQ